MTSNRMESDITQHRNQLRYHLQAALDATETAEKHFHIREAMQLLTIEER